MMDAIGNTLQGAAAIRGSSQQSVNQTAQPEADPLAGSVNEPSRYYSPVVRIDSETQRTVLQFRDGSDGKVLVQYPSEKQLEAYRSKATAERAKEQEEAEARISGSQEAAASTGQTSGAQTSGAQTGNVQRAGSPIAGQTTGRGESSGAVPSTSPATQSPISIPASTPRAGVSAPESTGPAVGGTGRPVLQSISA
jgi:hypothetical protein